MFTTSPYSWLAPVLVIVGVVLVLVVVGLVWRGRDGADRRPGPATYFFYGLSLVFLLVMLAGAGVAVHATAQAIGPSSSAPNLAPFENLPPCAATSSPSTTVPQEQLPCIDFGQSSSSVQGGVLPTGTPSSSSVGYLNLVSGYTDTDQYISAAVTAGLFALAGLIGFLVVWPRAKTAGTEAGEDQQRVRQFGVAYGYLVATLSVLGLLIFVPLAVDNVFKAIAPGVNNVSGHADGVRGFVTFTALSTLVAIALIYHLRYAQRLRETPPSTSDAGPAHPDPGSF